MTPDPYPDLSATELTDPATAAGDAAAPLELDEADSRLLAALTRPAPAVVTAVEDEPRTAGTGTQAGWRPARRVDGPLTPVFQEPS